MMKELQVDRGIGYVKDHVVLGFFQRNSEKISLVYIRPIYAG